MNIQKVKKRVSNLIKPRESFAYCALSHIKLNDKGRSAMLSMQI